MIKITKYIACRAAEIAERRLHLCKLRFSAIMHTKLLISKRIKLTITTIIELSCNRIPSEVHSHNYFKRSRSCDAFFHFIEWKRTQSPDQTGIKMGWINAIFENCIVIIGLWYSFTFFFQLHASCLDIRWRPYRWVSFRLHKILQALSVTAALVRLSLSSPCYFPVGAYDGISVSCSTAVMIASQFSLE